jgi:SpoVK/Ycf46/Vps4 family AAA+-type ATPase
MMLILRTSLHGVRGKFVVFRSHRKPHLPLANDVWMGLYRFSGADLAGLVREAAMTVLRRITQQSPDTVVPVDETVSAGTLKVTSADFEAALTRVRPSVSREDELEYERMYAVKSWSKLSK